MTAERATPKLRIGLIVDSLLVSKYTFEFVKRCLSNERLEVSHLLLRSAKSVRPPRAAADPASPSAGPIISNLFFAIIIGIEKLFLLRNDRHFDHLKKFDISALLPGIKAIQLHDDDVVNSDRPDLLINYSTPPPHDISTIAKLGLISLLHSDDYTYRAGPAGFWEVYFRRDVTAFAVERQSHAFSNSREVLLRGRIGTQFYYLLNQAFLFERSSHYLFKIVETIAASGNVQAPEPNWPVCHIPRSIPTVRQTILYLGGLIWLSAAKLFEKIRGYNYIWNVAFLRCDWRNAVLRNSILIENPPGHYMADPFVVAKDGREFCFVEDYDNAAKRGRISVFVLGRNGATFAGVALEEDFHLSYPYLFSYQGETFMCPETSEAREIRIYRCLDFPLQWKLEKTIIKNISAVDTMLFEKDGKWWMLTNTDPGQWGDHSLELRIFSAQSPLSDEWIPHPGNPFFIDATRARNGGMVTDGDRFFRVAQSLGFDFYGKRTSLYEIIELDDENYVETHVFDVAPAFKAGIAATHHLHSNGNITVIDFAHNGRAS
jgi:hypothetical protein